jgi:undecaprenyl pyrophosphate phosphatase UppP
MSFLDGLLLGLVQGFTEFLPISSTAHLRVVPALMGSLTRRGARRLCCSWAPWSR